MLEYFLKLIMFFVARSRGLYKKIQSKLLYPFSSRDDGKILFEVNNVLYFEFETRKKEVSSVKG